MELMRVKKKTRKNTTCKTTTKENGKPPGNKNDGDYDKKKGKKTQEKTKTITKKKKVYDKKQKKNRKKQKQSPKKKGEICHLEEGANVAFNVTNGVLVAPSRRSAEHSGGRGRNAHSGRVISCTRASVAECRCTDGTTAAMLCKVIYTAPLYSPASGKIVALILNKPMVGQ